MSDIEGYFEDFEEDMTFTTPRRTVTEADIVNFAGLSGDFNPIHIDAVHASGAMFGERIAHGLLGLAIASGLTSHLGFLGDKVQAFMGLEWKFKAPTYIGDTIHCELSVDQTKSMKRLGGGIVKLGIDVVNQEGDTVQKGTWTVLFKSRDADEDE